MMVGEIVARTDRQKETERDDRCHRGEWKGDAVCNDDGDEAMRGPRETEARRRKSRP